MPAALMHMLALVALIIGIAVANGAKTTPQLFAGLTLVICAVMMFCAGAVVGAIGALRASPAAQPPAVPPPHSAPPAHYPLS